MSGIACWFSALREHRLVPMDAVRWLELELPAD